MIIGIRKVPFDIVVKPEKYYTMELRTRGWSPLEKKQFVMHMQPHSKQNLKIQGVDDKLGYVKK